MDTYMERKLVGLHEAGSASGFKQKFLIFLGAVMIIFLIPVIHLGVIYYIWAPDKPRVDESKCLCHCFDTVIRGRYEWPPSSYKHIYLNSTVTSARIWFVIVLGVLGLREVVSYIGGLVWRRQVRVTMLVVLLSALYPHYYGWWGVLNYLNEDFYSQWWHQLFFSATELVSTALVLHLCNAKSSLEPWKLLLIVDINGMHIIVNCFDQFVNNVVFGRGQGFEALRDVGLILPDLFHVLVCYFELRIVAERRRTSLVRLFYKEELMMSFVIVTVCSILGKNL